MAGARRRARRYERLRAIEAMDVERDHSRIWLLDMAYEFPWDMQVGGSVGFYHSLAPPRMARLLARTGELTGNTRRRLDDTNILMWEMFRHGFTGTRGREAVRQMNRIHRNAVRHVNTLDGEDRWSITNEEYLFVLAAVMVHMVRAVDRHGWRPFGEAERRAAYLHFRSMGEHMGIKDLPESYEGFERFHDEYVRATFDYSPEAEALWRATRGLFVEVLVGWLPPRLHGIAGRAVGPLLPALLGPDLCRAFGLRPASPLLARAVRTALRARSVYVRWSPPRRESAMPDRIPTERFPEGEYEFPQVGPDHSTG
ncbi:hypothetical protein SUDANB121_05359 [Nocardiopsis dassonvillei]|uniref:oxygenase MpaB family protein n=1 Tax=Nocardiopsis dassonvillei TaxID=2014 RepID=UPI003F55DB96